MIDVLDKSMTLPQLPELAYIDMLSHAKAAWPFECCGVIINGRYIEKKNVAADPTQSFKIDPKEWCDDIDAVIHSHPNVDTIVPSSDDMTYQQSCGVPFGIIPTKMNWAGLPAWVGDYTLELPLVGRQSVHGITDCYALVRAYYWQLRKIRLKEVPRDPDWWLNQKAANLYLEHFQEVGFREVHDGMQEGDVLLMKLLPKTNGPHHAGIICGNSLMLHHWGGQLSCHVPLGSWMRRVTHRMRYVG